MKSKFELSQELREYLMEKQSNGEADATTVANVLEYANDYAVADREHVDHLIESDKKFRLNKKSKLLNPAYISEVKRAIDAGDKSILTHVFNEYVAQDIGIPKELLEHVMLNGDLGGYFVEKYSGFVSADYITEGGYEDPDLPIGHDQPIVFSGTRTTGVGFRVKQDVDVKERDTKDVYIIPAGSKVVNVKIIAGPGSFNHDTNSENPLDRAKFCVQHHGGEDKDWMKVHGDSHAQGHGIQGKALVNWYEHPTIGAVSRTIKQWYEDTVEDYYDDSDYYERSDTVKKYDENDKSTWGRALPPSHPAIKAAKEAARARGRAKREQAAKAQPESDSNKQ